MNDFSAETSQLLDRARNAGGLSDERRARIKTSVLTQVAAVGIAGSIGIGSASLASAAGAGKGAGLTATLIKGFSAVALLAAAGAGVYSVAHGTPSPQPKQTPPAQVAAAPVVAKPKAKAEPASEAEPLPEARELEAAPPVERPASGARSPSAAAVAPAAPVTPETLAEETRLLREADQALRAGNAARALSLLDEHQSRFPRGVLAPERRAERLLASCQLGHVDAKAARAYLASHPSSAFAARIRDACNAK